MLSLAWCTSNESHKVKRNEIRKIRSKQLRKNRQMSLKWMKLNCINTPSILFRFRKTLGNYKFQFNIVFSHLTSFLLFETFKIVSSFVHHPHASPSKVANTNNSNEYGKKARAPVSACPAHFQSKVCIQIAEKKEK